MLWNAWNLTAFWRCMMERSSRYMLVYRRLGQLRTHWTKFGQFKVSLQKRKIYKYLRSANNSSRLAWNYSLKLWCPTVSAAAYRYLINQVTAQQRQHKNLSFLNISTCRSVKRGISDHRYSNSIFTFTDFLVPYSQTTLFIFYQLPKRPGFYHKIITTLIF